MKVLLPTWAIKGGRVKRPLEPKEAGSRAMMETANGMVFCEDMMSTAIASLGGNLNSLHKTSLSLRWKTMADSTLRGTFGLSIVPLQHLDDEVLR